MINPIRVWAATQDDFAFVADGAGVAPAIMRRMIAEGDLLVAERDGAPVGFLRLERFWSKLPFIALIGVLPAYRRKGVGTALLEHLSAQLREQGHALLYSSSESHAAEAQAWHRHKGFEECGFIAGINSDGIGEIFFRKSLR